MPGRSTAYLAALSAVCSLAALGGCGNSRTTLPATSQPAEPGGSQWLAYPRSGIGIRAPSNWAVVKQRPPLVAAITSGNAVVAVWRFPRSSAPPAGSSAMSQAASQLISAARARDATLQLIHARPLVLDNHTAIELDAFEHINGQLRRVRSTHIFLAGAEIVLDEYAPPAMFHSVDHSVFSPVKRSLRLQSVTG